MRAVLILSLVAACASTPKRDAAVREAIAAAWDEHFVAVMRKDAAGVGRLYADDVVYIVPGECEVRGRAAIDEMEAKGLKSVDIRDVTHATEALRVYGDTAYEIGTVVGPVRPHGQPAKVVTFRYMARWKRQPEKHVGWHVFPAHWSIQYMIGEPER